MPGAATPFDQSTYQVRLEWGVEGLARLAPADIVVVVDVLRFSSTVIRALEDGGEFPLDDDARAVSINGAVVAEAAARLDAEPRARLVASASDVASDGAGDPASDGAGDTARASAGDTRGAGGALVLLGGLRNAAAVAAAIAAEQESRGIRTSVAIIAAGERTSPDAASPLRFAVEDHLGAGAIIVALAHRGIDHSSPEAAAAGESFRALRGAVRHLLTASGSGRELAERRDEVLAAASVDASTVVPALRGGVFASL